MLLRVAAESARAIGVIPIVFVGWRQWGERHTVDASAWWIAAALLLSWVADLAAGYVGHPLPSRVYPVAQAALIGCVLLDRTDAAAVLFTLGAVGMVGLAANPLPNDDILLHLVAWGAIAGLVWQRPSLASLRTALLVYFGGGALLWLAYVVAPGWPTWLAYQGSRLAGAVWFCAAVRYDKPQFTIERGGLARYRGRVA